MVAKLSEVTTDVGIMVMGKIAPDILIFYYDDKTSYEHFNRYLTGTKYEKHTLLV